MITRFTLAMITMSTRIIRTLLALLYTIKVLFAIPLFFMLIRDTTTFRFYVFIVIIVLLMVITGFKITITFIQLCVLSAISTIILTGSVFSVLLTIRVIMSGVTII